MDLNETSAEAPQTAYTALAGALYHYIWDSGRGDFEKEGFFSCAELEPLARGRLYLDWVEEKLVTAIQSGGNQWGMEELIHDLFQRLTPGVQFTSDLGAKIGELAADYHHLSDSDQSKAWDRARGLDSA